jgi:hypothetical protein
MLNSLTVTKLIHHHERTELVVVPGKTCPRHGNHMKANVVRENIHETWPQHGRNIATNRFVLWVQSISKISGNRWYIFLMCSELTVMTALWPLTFSSTAATLPGASSSKHTNSSATKSSSVNVPPKFNKFNHAKQSVLAIPALLKYGFPRFNLPELLIFAIKLCTLFSCT